MRIMGRLGKAVLGGLVGLIGTVGVANASTERTDVTYNLPNNGTQLKVVHRDPSEESKDLSDSNYSKPAFVGGWGPGVYTFPFQTNKFKLDVRPELSESLFIANLDFINDSSSLVNVSSGHNLNFIFVNNSPYTGMDTNRAHIAKVSLNSPYLNGGNFDFSFIVSNNYNLNLPGLSGVPAKTTNNLGILIQSSEFMNKTNATGKNLPCSINLAEKQFPGLSYALGATNCLNGGITLNSNGNAC